MERFAKVRFMESWYGHVERYIHKYYLPQELRSRIFPVDIVGISHCFTSDDELDVWEGQIPENVPDCLIQYKDIGLEKRIDGETARRVLLAKATYCADIRGELTTEENQAAMNLNAWLREWEKNLLARCIQLSSEMEREVRSSDSWLTDYEIDVEVAFYIRDDDPFYREIMPEALNEDIDLLCTMKQLVSIPVLNRKHNAYWGIGDNQDHNDCRGYRNEKIYNMPHCATFHELFGHMQVPIKHAGRIGCVYTDIIVRHQNGITVDLKGKQALAVLHEPRIREGILFCDEVKQKPANP